MATMLDQKIYGYLTVPEGAPAMNVHRYETASAYDTLVPTPGTYPVVPSSTRGRVECRVPAIRVESYYENRLGSASSAQHKMDLNQPDTYHWSMYAYEVHRTIRTDIGTFEPA